MKTKRSFLNAGLFVSAMVAVAVALSPAETRAKTIALSFTTHEGNGGAVDETVGWSFSLGTGVRVTDLGVFDGNFNDFGNGTGDGLDASYVVTIWTSTGAEVAQAEVPSGSSAPYLDGFRYVSLSSPVSLLPGNYVIGAYYGVDQNEAYAAEVNPLKTATGVTYTGKRIADGNVFPAGSAGDDLKNEYFGPNFQFTAPTNAVPESGGTILLMVVAIAVLVTLNAIKSPVRG
jgi:hypothetical protein